MTIHEQLTMLSLKQQEVNFNISQINSFVKKTRIDVTDNRKEEKKYSFYFSDGIVSFLKYLLFNKDTNPIHTNMFYTHSEYE